MTKSPMSYEVPAELRDFAEKSVEQAKKAVDGFLGAASKAVSAVETQANTVQANNKEVVTKTIGYAEQNIAAAFDFAQKLVRSKDVQEVMQHQTEYLKHQVSALQSQMQELGTHMQGSLQKAASEAQANMQKAASEVQASVQKATDAVTKRK